MLIDAKTTEWKMKQDDFKGWAFFVRRVDGTWVNKFSHQKSPYFSVTIVARKEGQPDQVHSSFELLLDNLRRLG